MELTVGNLLTLLSIGIAVMTFSYNTNNKLVVYKFSTLRKIILVLLFLFVLYLVYFSKFESAGVYFESLMFPCDWLPTAQQWAFPMAIVLLVYLLFVLFKASFPERYYDDIIAYYTRLTSENPLSLIRNITDYHSDDIKAYIKKMNGYLSNSSKPFWLRSKDEQDEYERVSNDIGKSSATLEARVFNEIICTENFIDATYDKAPMLYLQLASLVNSKRYGNVEESTKYYFKKLIENSNSTLIDGLNKTINFAGPFPGEVLYRISDSKFAECLFENFDYAVKCGSNYSFGEAALDDISDNKDFYISIIEYPNENKRKERPAYLCLRYNDILMRQFQYYVPDEKVKDYYYYPYYWLVMQGLAKFDVQVEEKSPKNEATILFWDYMSNLRDWIRCFVYTRRAGQCKGVISLYISQIIDYLQDVLSLEMQKSLRLQLVEWLFMTSEEEVKMHSADGYKEDVISPIIFEALKGLINKEKEMMNLVWEKVDHPKYSAYRYYDDIKGLLGIE